MPQSPGAVGAKWAWLAPVMGCFLAMMVVSSSRSNQLGGLTGALATNWLAAVASNQSYAAYIVADFHSGQNALQNSTIEWASQRQVVSDRLPGSFPFQATNTPNRN